MPDKEKQLQKVPNQIQVLLARANGFMWPFVIWSIISTAAMQVVGNHNLFLRINKFFSPAADFFFTYFTYFGDGLFNVILAAILAFRNRWQALLMLICFGVSGGLSSLLKKVIIGDLPRPVLYFREIGVAIRTIPGIDLPEHHTFPSGHSITVFSAFILLSIFVNKNNFGFVFFVLAALTAFSRVYLAVHFPVDVLAGSIIGVASNALVLVICVKYFPKFLEKAELL
jgi:membrane-associated phospholipid phosphatase